MNMRCLTDGEVLCFISPLSASDHLKHCCEDSGEVLKEKCNQ